MQTMWEMCLTVLGMTISILAGPSRTTIQNIFPSVIVDMDLKQKKSERLEQTRTMWDTRKLTQVACTLHLPSVQG